MSNGFLLARVSNTEANELNLVHVGDLIKIGFRLNGDRALSVFAAGSPTSTEIPCPSWRTNQSQRGNGRPMSGHGIVVRMEFSSPTLAATRRRLLARHGRRMKSWWDGLPQALAELAGR
jgi:hypothetical protein